MVSCAVGWSALEAGQIIESRYRLEHWLGSGGMGVVWAATELHTARTVAIKFLRPELSVDCGTHQRFLREARTASSVRHPNVVGVHDVLENDGFPAIVMDLLHGETLAMRVAAVGALTIRETAALLSPVVSAIGAAHACGVVHRDLKPDNVFICDGVERIFERVRVLDFGIAKRMQNEPGLASTRTGTLLGSPLYMSPEQVFCEGNIDHRTDAWSLGITLYECLAGFRPTSANTIGQTLKIITAGLIRPLAECAPEVPPEIAELVDALLSRVRSRRPELAAVHRLLRSHAPEDESPDFAAPAVPASQGRAPKGDSFTATLDAFSEKRAPISLPRSYPRSYLPSQRQPPTTDAVALPTVAIGSTPSVWRRRLMFLGLFVAVTALAWEALCGLRPSLAHDLGSVPNRR